MIAPAVQADISLSASLPWQAACLHCTSSSLGEAGPGMHDKKGEQPLRPPLRDYAWKTLVLYRKRAVTKEAYLNTVVQRAFDKAA